MHNTYSIPLIEENRKVWYDADRTTTGCGIRPHSGSEGADTMIKGLGLDLCGISRMEKLLGDERFLNRYFGEDEIAYIRSKGKNAAQTMAGIYAAKEAFSKALGTGIAFELKEIRICHDAAGKPGYILSGKAEELGQGDSFLLSVSHDAGMAAAVCVREDNHSTERR